MEQKKRAIVLAIGLVGLATSATLIAAILIPFAVNVPASLVSLSGTVEYLSPHQRPRQLQASSDIPFALQAGDSLHIAAESRAILTLQVGHGRIVTNGPTTLSLVRSAREATLLGHLFGSERFPRRYTLVLRQTGGMASYVFEAERFASGRLNLSVQLPDRIFVPDQPCWAIVFPDEGPPSVREYPCTP
ncbi:MAG: hypothetical protein ACUVSU_01890 [Aggregatilineaceae bacterium]